MTLRTVELSLSGRRVTCRTTTGDLTKPLVVLLHGAGAHVDSWAAVQRQLDGSVASVAYGRNEATVCSPVSATDLSENLRALLRSGGWEPPYVLVGHSWGGVVARTFAQSAPAEVSALVLLDATHEELRSLAAWRLRTAVWIARRAAWLPLAGGRRLATARELADLPESLRQLRPPTVPTWALVAGHASRPRQRVVREDFAAAYDRLAETNDWVRYDVIHSAGHDLPRQAPETVVRTIEEALAFVETGALL